MYHSQFIGENPGVCGLLPQVLEAKSRCALPRLESEASGGDSASELIQVSAELTGVVGGGLRPVSSRGVGQESELLRLPTS